MEDDTAQEMKRRRKEDRLKREANVGKARREEQQSYEQAADKYRPSDLRRRIRQINQLSAEHQKNDVVLDHLALRTLQSSVEKKQFEVDRRHAKREKKLERLRVEELNRLKEILLADAPGRQEERGRNSKLVK